MKIWLLIKFSNGYKELTKAKNRVSLTLQWLLLKPLSTFIDKRNSEGDNKGPNFYTKFVYSIKCKKCNFWSFGYIKNDISWGGRANEENGFLVFLRSS